MARYIDADALLSRLPDGIHKWNVRRVLDAAPTEDVVTREEVELLKTEIEGWAIQSNARMLEAMRLKQEKNALAAEIFAEIEEHLETTMTLYRTITKYSMEAKDRRRGKNGFEALQVFAGDVANIKRKYIGGKNDAEIH